MKKKKPESLRENPPNRYGMLENIPADMRNLIFGTEVALEKPGVDSEAEEEK